MRFFLLIPLVAIIFVLLTSCVTTPPPVRECLVVVRGIDAEQKAAGRPLVRVTPFDGGDSVVYHKQDEATGVNYVILLDSLGAEKYMLTEEPKYDLVERCTHARGSATIYKRVLSLTEMFGESASN